MKHLLVLLAILLSGYSAQAQLEKGTFAVGGNLSTGIWRGVSNPQRGIQLTPQLGYVVRRNVLIGVSIPVQQTTLEFDKPALWANVQRIQSMSVGVSVFFRRYLLATRMRPFILADATYNRNSWGRSRFTYVPGSTERPLLGSSTTSRVRLGLGVGVGYFVSKQLSIDATAALNISDTEGAIDSRKLRPSNRYLLLGAGANWYWGGRQKTNP